MKTTISNESLSVTVTTEGGSLTSIQADGREYLWQPDPAVWTGQAPICFPICGGLRDGQATTESGKKVELARHGLAKSSEFEVASAADDACVLRLASSDATRAQYPFDFVLEARYALEGAHLRVTYAVTNTGAEPMPFFIGGHPAFRCPVEEGEKYSDYELRFDKAEAAELCSAVPSTGLIDVENRTKNPMAGQVLPITHELFDFAETIFDVLESRKVELTGPAGHGVRLEFDDFPYLVVWSKPIGDFVAVEPWGGLSTCSDEDDVLEHKRGCIVAAPGQTVERSFTVEPF